MVLLAPQAPKCFLAENIVFRKWEEKKHFRNILSPIDAALRDTLKNDLSFSIPPEKLFWGVCRIFDGRELLGISDCNAHN